MPPIPSHPDPLARLRAIVAQLRAPDGCPWDREQSHVSLAPALVEETYETLDAITRADDANLREELGDLLLHVVLHAQIAAERGAFDFDQVAAEVGEKMVRRHPHVFGAESAADSGAVLRRWDEIKRAEKRRLSPPGGNAGNGGADQPAREWVDPVESALDGVPVSFPALLRAQKLQRQAARVGFDWTDPAQVWAKVREEVAEVEEVLARPPAGPGPAPAEALAGELGDLLFSVVNFVRWQRLEAELLLQRASDKFSARFRGVEARARGVAGGWGALTPEDLDRLWREVKRAEPVAAALPPP